MKTLYGALCISYISKFYFSKYFVRKHKLIPQLYVIFWHPESCLKFGYRFLILDTFFANYVKNVFLLRLEAAFEKGSLAKSSGFKNIKTTLCIFWTTNFDDLVISDPLLSRVKSKISILKEKSCINSIASP